MLVSGRLQNLCQRFVTEGCDRSTTAEIRISRDSTGGDEFPPLSNLTCTDAATLAGKRGRCDLMD